jgi:putative colanic acid biosynthesis acetyltransferase WcaF
MCHKTIDTRLNIAANRAAKKYSGRELVARLCWSLTQPFFRFSPRPCYFWRRWLLRRFGSRIQKQVHIHNTVQIQYPWLLEIGEFAAIGDRVIVYNLGRIKIGQRATISQNAYLCAGSHDYTRAEMPLEREPIDIGNDAWICAQAFIGPGVVIGEGAVVGARAAVFDDVPPWSVVGGNPAKFIKKRELRENC